MNAAGGYWFCSHCEDTVTLPAPLGRWDRTAAVACPVCHHFTADWKRAVPAPAIVPDKTADVPTPEEAKELFGKIYDQIKNLPADEN